MRRTMMGLIAAAVLGIGFLASAALVAPVQGQDKVSVQGHGGLSIPTGRLKDLTRPGPSLGLRMSYSLAPRTALTLNGDVDQLGGAKLGAVRAPDMRMWRYGVGLQRAIVAPRNAQVVESRGGATRARPTTRWSVYGDVGLGAARFDSDAFTTGGSTTDFRKTYLETNAGVMVAYDALPWMRLFAGTRGSLSFADKGDTAVLAGLDPRSQARAFGSTLTIPLSTGFTIRM